MTVVIDSNQNNFSVKVQPLWTYSMQLCTGWHEEDDAIVSYVLIQKQGLAYLLKVVCQYPTSLVDLGRKFNGET